LFSDSEVSLKMREISDKVKAYKNVPVLEGHPVLTVHYLGLFISISIIIITHAVHCSVWVCNVL